MEFDTIGLMTIRSKSHAEAALQYLIWALEEVEKAANQKAAHHVRSALDALRESGPDQMKD